MELIFGFDGDVAGFRNIVWRIAHNEKVDLTHKEVRAYARCMLKLLPLLQISGRFESEIKTMLAVISMSGLPHYDRSFMAERILKLLDADSANKSDKEEGIF